MINVNTNIELKRQVDIDREKLLKYKLLYTNRIDMYEKNFDESNPNISKINRIIDNFHEEIKKIDIALQKLIEYEHTNYSNILDNENYQYNSEYKKIVYNIISNFVVKEDILLNFMDENKENELIKNNDTLQISEPLGKVILPYTGREVKEIFENSEEEFESIDDVIEKRFTRPLSDYRFPMISRYKETLKLVVEREKYSFLDAISLALEMMRNRYLHPAIITACRKLDELDVYLDCLDKNELDDFKIFKIEYDLYPIEIKKFFIKTKKYNKNLENIEKED